MKKINLILLLLTLVTTLSFAQNSDFEAETASSNFESPKEQFNSKTYATSLQEEKTFRENSIGVMFMPIPLFIDEINIDGTEFTTDDNFFNSGVGITFNFDFNKRGLGFGAFGYIALIGGDDLDAEDYFAALKYDIRLGGLNSNFEISPLIGVGNLRFNTDDGNLGTSFYASGGARITWRISNRFFFGADIITVPLIFNEADLLGLDDQGLDVELDYKFLAQFNLSLRYNIFLSRDQ
jgi:hypothetical protein